MAACSRVTRSAWLCTCPAEWHIRCPHPANPTAAEQTKLPWKEHWWLQWNTGFNIIKPNGEHWIDTRSKMLWFRDQNGSIQTVRAGRRFGRSQILTSASQVRKQAYRSKVDKTSETRHTGFASQVYESLTWGICFTYLPQLLLWGPDWSLCWACHWSLPNVTMWHLHTVFTTLLEFRGASAVPFTNEDQM